MHFFAKFVVGGGGGGGTPFLYFFKQKYYYRYTTRDCQALSHEKPSEFECTVSLSTFANNPQSDSACYHRALHAIMILVVQGAQEYNAKRV